MIDTYIIHGDEKLPYLAKPSHPKKVEIYRKPVYRFYDDKRWYAMRSYFRLFYPVCWNCEAEERSTIATELHHIIPISKGFTKVEQEELAFDYKNCMPVCIECHHLLHREIDNDYNSYLTKVEGMKKGLAF